MKIFQNLFFKSVIIFVLFFSLFLFGHLLSSGLTSTDDPYYHAKHSFLIEQSGNLTLLEPWMEFNFLNYAPTDLWWGFHLGMALFIHWFGLMLGVKIFISFLAALVFLVFYLILNNLKIKYPSAWIWLLFFSSMIFSYRLFLQRPHLLSMIVLPLAFLLMLRGKNFWLFILSLCYVLSYHLAIIVIFQTLIYLAVEAYFSKRVNLRPLIASLGGVAAGIIIHPNSLNYLYMIYIIVTRFFFLKFSGIDLGVGGELRTIDIADFISTNFLALTFYILAVALFLALRKVNKNSVIRNFLFLYSSFWFLVTLSVPRGVEYWLPATLLFGAVVFNDFMVTEDFKICKQFLNRKINFKITGFFLAFVLTFIIIYNLGQVYWHLYRSETGDLGRSYEQVNGWLKANTEKGSVIFYDNWGKWPMMFYYNDYNHYIIGIDPESTYEYDQRTYWLWRNISAYGLYCDQPTPCLNLTPADQLKLVPLTIKSVFRAKHVVVSNHEANSLIKTLDNLRSGVELVFKNKDLLIYEIE